MSPAPIRVAIAGIGNCASSLLQGIDHYRSLPAEAHQVWGLMHLEMGGYRPSDVEVVAAFEQMPENASALASSIKASPLAKTYPETNWEASFRKMGELGSRDYDWTEPVKAIKAPTLLIFADADYVRPEHIVEFYKALGGGQRDAGLDGSLRPVAQLAIVPGATHYKIAGDPALPSIIKAFLGENSAK